MIVAELALLDRQRPSKGRLRDVQFTRRRSHARQIGERAGGLDMVWPVLPLAELDHRLHQWSQSQSGLRLDVVGELAIEPRDEGLRVRNPTMVVRFGERATSRGRHALGARDLGARAPKRTNPLVAALALLLQHAGVGDLMKEVVLEDEFAGVQLRITPHHELLA